jgi:hypothetical protein
MFTWEGISYIITCFISNTNLVILMLVKSSESPYCPPDLLLSLWDTKILWQLWKRQTLKFSQIFYIAVCKLNVFQQFYLTDPSEMLTRSLAQNKVSVWLWVFMSSYPLPNKWPQDAKNLRTFVFSTGRGCEVFFLKSYNVMSKIVSGILVTRNLNNDLQYQIDTSSTNVKIQNKVSVWLWVFMSSYPLPNKWPQDAKNLRVFYCVWTCYFQPIWRFFPIMFLMQFPSCTMSTAILWLLYTLFMILGGQNGAITFICRSITDLTKVQAQKRTKRVLLFCDTKYKHALKHVSTRWLRLEGEVSRTSEMY